MILRKIIFASFLLTVFAVSGAAQDTGSIKGKVHVEKGPAAGVAVIARQNDRDIARVETDRKGDFTINGLAPGMYELTFRRTGLSVGTIENVDVRAGKVRTLNDRLVLSVDTGSIAFVRGSVFNADGRSVPGVRVELLRVGADGTAKKLFERVTSDSGEFVFRLSPEKAKYRVRVKASGTEAAPQDVEVEGAAIYRTALSLKPVAGK
jgi:hypothetical protein